ncbi:MAG: group II intron reverse transcriptase/maturase [Moorea sp. SIO3C2]|nr:group II intron reverse transcriptase/maturase [Moorena sp. SIO3C2]
MNPVFESRYEWRRLPWPRIEREVFKLQRRIYQAAQRHDQRNVHRLQRLLCHSWYARLLSVRRVSQDNRGKRTAGIDGVCKLKDDERLDLAQRLDLRSKAKGVRRIWIAKPNSQQKRPLGIPVMAERAAQAWVKLALEPEWEARFEANSYGFRPGRNAHDAIAAIFNAIVHRPKYVLDADIAQCFDRIEHTQLLSKLNAPPWLSRPIRGWLKAGAWQQGEWYATSAGTPQGGVLSPLLANVALHGMEQYLKAQFPAYSYSQAGRRIRVLPIQVIRYADDFVVLHPDEQVIHRAKAALEAWLSQMGLQLKPSKTSIVHTLGAEGVDTGFDFLGFHIRQFPINPRHKACGYKTIIKPSPIAMHRHYQQLRHLVRSHRGRAQQRLIASLNHSIQGWSRYYSTVVSSQCFSRMDNQLRQLLLRWTKRQSGQNAHQQMARYWGIDRGLGWSFCTPDNYRLIGHREMPIKRHIKVRQSKSPFDGDWLYWAARRGWYPGTSTRVAQLLKRQEGRCSYCGQFFDAESVIEVHHRNRNRNDNSLKNLCALHGHCHDRVHGEGGHP